MRKQTRFNYKMAFRFALLCIALLVGTVGILLFDGSAIAQQRITTGYPTLELIGETDTTGSFQLTINDSRDIIFVSCEEGLEASLSYLRNTQALQCQAM